MPLQDLPPLTDPAVLGDRDEPRAATTPEVPPADRPAATANAHDTASTRGRIDRPPGGTSPTR